MARASSPRAPEALLDLTHDVFAERSPARVGEAVLDAIGRAVPYDYGAFQEIDAHRVAIGWTVQWPENLVAPRDVPLFVYHLKRDHPLLPYFARVPGSGPRALSDFMTRRQFHRTGLYTDCYRAVGAEFQIATPLPLRPRQGFGQFIALNRRRRDFSADERRFLELARAPVALAMQNAQAFDAVERRLRQLHMALEECDQGLAVADWRGRILLRTERARVLIDRYFGPGRPSAWLPGALRAWARQWLAELSRAGAGRPLVVERGGTRLVVRLLPDWTRRECVLLVDETETDPTAALDGLSLSRREREVLSWVARGKTNAEVGELLAISARTVQKHLEHVFDKLGVATRTAAAARAAAWLDRLPRVRG